MPGRRQPPGGGPLLQEEPRYQLVEGHSGCTFLVLIARRLPGLDGVGVSITYPALVALLPGLAKAHWPHDSGQFRPPLASCCLTPGDADGLYSSH